MINNNTELPLVNYLLEKREVSIPIALIKHSVFHELEQALKTAVPFYSLSRLFESFSLDLSLFFKEDDLDDFIKMLKNAKQNWFRISDDDQKIIQFLSSVSNNVDFVLEVIGPAVFLLNVVTEINDSRTDQNLSENLRMFLLIASYVFLYELVLYEIDRRLYFYLSRGYTNYGAEKLKKKSEFKNFLERIERENEHDHATAGIINSILSDLAGLPRDNNSIFGGKAEIRILRNKAAHANIFYDSERDLIILGGKVYEKGEFLEAYFRLFSFLIAWIEGAVGINVNNSYDFKKKIYDDIKNYFRVLARNFKKIGRSGLLRYRFTNMVISWKKEVGLL